MGSTLGTLLASVGLLVAAGAVLLLLSASGLTGGAPAGGLVLGAAGGFLVGVFAFAYGVGRRASY